MKVSFVHGEDWIGLYVDDRLVMEGHSLKVAAVLNALGIEFEDFDADPEWLGDRGTLPKTLASAKRHCQVWDAKKRRYVPAIG